TQAIAQFELPGDAHEAILEQAKQRRPGFLTQQCSGIALGLGQAMVGERIDETGQRLVDALEKETPAPLDRIDQGERLAATLGDELVDVVSGAFVDLAKRPVRLEQAPDLLDEAQ